MGCGPAELSYPAGSMLLIGGPVGVGKSTLIARLAPSAAVLSMDEIRGDLQEQIGISRTAFDRSCLNEASYLYTERLLDHLAAGESVVCDQAACALNQQVYLASLAAKHGRQGHVLMLDGSAEMCLAGQARRRAPIPAEKVHSYVTWWQELSDRIANAPAEFLSETGWRTVTVMDRPAADQLQSLRFV